MHLRLELFVDDLAASVAFYRDALGFTVDRADDDYVSIRNGEVVLGLGPVAKLPPDDTLGFSRRELALARGAGTEIVLELDTETELLGLHDRLVSRGFALAAPLRTQPWGLRDFRLRDPDGYYLRLTHLPAARAG